MPSKAQKPGSETTHPQQHPLTERAQTIATPPEQSHSVAGIQQARITPRLLTPRDVLQLQRTIGNRAVGRLLRNAGTTEPTKPAPSATGQPAIQRVITGSWDSYDLGRLQTEMRRRKNGGKMKKKGDKYEKLTIMELDKLITYKRYGSGRQILMPPQQPALHPPVPQFGFQAPLQQPVLAPLQQPVLQQPVPQLGLQAPLQQPVLAPLQQPVLQQPVPQPGLQAPLQQPVLQQPVPQLGLQAPLQQPVLQQPVPQLGLQAPLQQPVLQQPVPQLGLQAPLQQPVIQPPIQVPIPQPLIQQPAQQQDPAEQVLRFGYLTLNPLQIAHFFVAKNGVSKKMSKAYAVGPGTHSEEDMIGDLANEIHQEDPECVYIYSTNSPCKNYTSPESKTSHNCSNLLAGLPSAMGKHRKYYLAYHSVWAGTTETGEAEEKVIQNSRQGLQELRDAGWIVMKL